MEKDWLELPERVGVGPCLPQNSFPTSQHATTIREHAMGDLRQVLYAAGSPPISESLLWG